LQVKCTECGYESNTFDPFLDISLEINRAGSVEKALERFTCREYLDGENKYKCAKEDKLVKAVKCITISQAPNVLVLQLKRFEFTRHGRKVTKKVRFLSTAPRVRN
jgi:ubiquitin carboxyl-terminal hydrolase 36/42